MVGWSAYYLDGKLGGMDWQKTGGAGLIDLVGPHGYIHGWIKVGMDVKHKDGSIGKVAKYDPNTQTVHADWHSGPRAGKAGKATTKAYHVTEHKAAPEVKAPEVVPAKVSSPHLLRASRSGFSIERKSADAADHSKQRGSLLAMGYRITHDSHPLGDDVKARPVAKVGVPTLKSHPALGYKLGGKVAAKGAPEGVTVHKLEGANESHAVFRDGEHIGYIDKRSGVSTVGNSGSAHYVKNTGYNAYDLRHTRVALGESTLGDAATTVHRSAPARTIDKAPSVESAAGGSLGDLSGASDDALRAHVGRLEGLPSAGPDDRLNLRAARAELGRRAFAKAGKREVPEASKTHLTPQVKTSSLPKIHIATPTPQPSRPAGPSAEGELQRLQLRRLGDSDLKSTHDREQGGSFIRQAAAQEAKRRGLDLQTGKRTGDLGHKAAIYREMHGDAGVRAEIARLSGLSRRSPSERDQLAALQALPKTPFGRVNSEGKTSEAGRVVTVRPPTGPKRPEDPFTGIPGAGPTPTPPVRPRAKERVHGWVQAGATVVHKDGSTGKVSAYAPATQTTHVDWRTGKRAGTSGTTKAYHIKPVESAVSHPNLYHVTTDQASADAIKTSGFHGKRGGEQGGYFSGSALGQGTYLHTDKAHSDEYLKGEKQYGSDGVVQIPAHANVKNPFVVHATESDRIERTSEGGVFERALKKQGVLAPHEQLKQGLLPGGVSQNEVTRRLRERGHDAVQVRQSGKYNGTISGSQLVVFDPENVGFGHRSPAAPSHVAVTGPSGLPKGSEPLVRDGKTVGYVSPDQMLYDTKGRARNVPYIAEPPRSVASPGAPAPEQVAAKARRAAGKSDGFVEKTAAQRRDMTPRERVSYYAQKVLHDSTAHPVLPVSGVRMVDQGEMVTPSARGEYRFSTREIKVSKETASTPKLHLDNTGWNTPRENAHNQTHATLTHEYGHHLDRYMDQQHRAQMMTELSQHLQFRPDRLDFTPEEKARIINKVGTYASKNKTELLAELYAEYKLAHTPRQAARIVGKYMEEQ